VVPLVDLNYSPPPDEPGANACFSAWLPQAHSNYKQLFLLIGIGVSASCSIVHGAKQLAKHAVSKAPPRLSALHLEQAVGFTAEILLPTPFFGPYLTLYCLLGVVLREHELPPSRPEVKGSRSDGCIHGRQLQDRQEQDGRIVEEEDQEERQRMLRTSDSDLGESDGSEESTQ
jgi:hypothetical protein